MFRRKEEGLFDNNSEVSQLEVEETVTVISSPSSSSSSSGSSASSAPSSYAGSSSSSPSAAPARASESRPVSSFRQNNPASALSSELSRSRIPADAKPASAPASSSSVSSGSSFSGGSLGGGKAGKRVLTVGNDILLKGEIATCDRLVIEGKVDASLNDVHTVEISETGSFKGSAQIEDAEISGLFEGDLVVRNRLVIYATGKVRGKITYGEVEIERGGELSGEIKTTSTQSQGASSRSMRQQKDEKVAA